MKNRTLVRTMLVAALLLAGIPSWSQTGSLDTWVDGCEVTDNDLRELLRNEALVVDRAALTPNPDGTYRLSNRAYLAPACSATPLCFDSRFYNQRQVRGFTDCPDPVAYRFRSAIQVGPDLVLTAFHQTILFDPTTLVAIFGLRYRMVGSICTAPDFDHIPAANVFPVTEIVADLYPAHDFHVLRLDHNAAATYPRVRRSGQGQNGDSMTLISHPERLATKTDLAGTLIGYSGPSPAGPIFENLHALKGSSGGALYNRTERFVETVARSGFPAAHYSLNGTCYTLTHQDGQFSTHEYTTVPVAPYIPAFELLVTPLDTVDHVCNCVSCDNSPYTRIVEADDSAPGDIDFEIELPNNPNGEPQLHLLVPGLQGTLSPGNSFDVVETVNPNGALSGQYERTYNVKDLTHGFTDIVRHTFTVTCP